MTKRLLLEGRDWSNDIKKKVLETFQYTHVINTLYKQKSLHGLTLSSIQSTIKCSCQFTCTFMKQYLFFCFKLFSRKMSHSLSYKEDKCVSKTCQTSKNTKRGIDSKYPKRLQYPGVFDYNEFENKTTHWEILMKLFGGKISGYFLLHNRFVCSSATLV